MAAYAALVSLMHIIKQIQHHPRPPFCLDNKHAESLLEKIDFLQNFLEDYSHVHNEEADRLQSRIADAAYAAEDVIETHVVDQILAQSGQHGIRICSVDFYHDLKKIIQDMDFIKKEVMEIKDKMASVKDFQHRRSLMPAAGSSRYPLEGKNIMMGFDDVLMNIMDMLTRQKSNCQIIPIVGMGGIGKTTLTRNVYENPLIVQHFDIRAWATISQEFSVKEILLQLLCEKNQDCRKSLGEKREEELGEILYKRLWRRRYLIIMDDTWSIEAWDKVKLFLPDNNNGSAIIITTRLSNVALHFTHCPGDHGLEMSFLNNDISWSLLCKIVFGEDGCPLELEEIGRKIVKNCKGLPLSIVVIGGLLAKYERLLEYWEYIAQNLNSIVNLEDKEHCLNLLRMSYDHLSVHLKPCFLYMGIFEEDAMIFVNELTTLWVAEGFLKPISGKSLENVAEEYLNDLMDRNLILVRERDHNGKIICFKIHDLLRDLCLREAEKDKFLLVTTQYSLNNFPQGINTQRRVVIRQSTLEEGNGNYLLQIRDALQSATLLRSLICYTPKFLPSPNCRLLRILKVSEEDSESSQQRYSLEAFIFQLINLRCIIACYSWQRIESQFPSSASLFWNLQTLGADVEIKAIELWKMPLLRHLQVFKCHVPNPEHDDFVLENLQELSCVLDFWCNKKMVKRIPNIKVLRAIYYDGLMGSRYCLNNLACLHILELLALYFYGPREMLNRIDLVQNLTFPHSLKELTLYGCRFHWEDILTMVGSLPVLQKLKLVRWAVLGSNWVTIEDQFCSLKSLTIAYSDLECWTTDSTHFPCLKHLVLECLHQLKEIPWDIGEIATLQSIELEDCSFSSIISAKKIVEEQEENGNEDLRVRVILWEKNEEVESLASHNFQVQRVEISESDEDEGEFD